jgi:hypothetical protein
MLEAAQILGSFSFVFLILAGAAALQWLGGVELRKLDGSAFTVVGNARVALWLLMGALVASAVAAVFAILHATVR